MPKYYKKKTTKKYKFRRRYGRRRRAASKIQKYVRNYIARKRGKRRIRSFARRRLNYSMNSLAAMSKVYSFSTYLERHMVPQDNYFVDDTNTGVTAAGILCGSKNGTAPSFVGQLQIALRCGPLGMFDSSVPVSNFRSLNSRCDDVMSQWKSFKIVSTKFTFTPVDSGRAQLDTQRQSTSVTNNATSNVAFKNLIAAFVIDQGNRGTINPVELCGSQAWQAPQAGPPPAGTISSGKVYSLGGDTANLCDVSVRKRLVSSTDRKSFSFTIYPVKKDSPIYQIKTVLRSLTSTPTDYIRQSGWASCDDWIKMFTGAWSSAAELPNNALFNGTLSTPPLSVGIVLPTRFDYAGNPLQIPLWRVIVTQKVRFKGLRST